MVERTRIVSADSHVTIPREQLLAHLPTRLHEPLAAAEMAYYQKMLATKPQKKHQQQKQQEAAGAAEHGQGRSVVGGWSAG